MGVNKQSSLNRKDKHRKPSADSVEYRFLSHTLRQADKDWLGASDALALLPLSLLPDFVSEGFKVSFSYDDRNRSFLCSITDKRGGSPFQGCILTGRGSSLDHAWLAVAYRHVVLSEGDWAMFDVSSSVEVDDFG